MTRLYDRVMRKGIKPFRLQTLVPVDLIVAERGGGSDKIEIPVGTQRVEREWIEGLPVIALDDVAEYVRELHVRKHESVGVDDLFGVIRPPFDRCFVEFKGQPWGLSGVGWVLEVTENDGYSDESPDEPRWLLGMTLIIDTGTVFGPCATLQYALDLHGESIRRDGKVIAGEFVPSMTPKPTTNELDSLLPLAHYLALPVVFGLSLMNCKNVSMREVAPLPKVAMRAAKKYGYPLVTFKTLDIAPMRRILDTEGEAQTKGLRHALHICRGHFKTFTEDAPLFGKHIGTYWWPAYVRGNADVGVVEKDYRIRLDSDRLGEAYREADENVTVTPAEEKPDEPDTTQRGFRAHNRTQNLLAVVVEEAGFAPRSPRGGEPDFDLVWVDDGVVWVAEVKSEDDPAAVESDGGLLMDHTVRL